MTFDDRPRFRCHVCHTSVTMTCSHGAPLPPNLKDVEISSLKASLKKATDCLKWYANPDHYKSRSIALSCGCCSEYVEPVVLTDEGLQAKITLDDIEDLEISTGETK